MFLLQSPGAWHDKDAPENPKDPLWRPEQPLLNIVASLSNLSSSYRSMRVSIVFVACFALCAHLTIGGVAAL